MKQFIESQQATVCEGRDRHSLIATFTFLHNDKIRTRFDVIPIDSDWTVLTGTRLIGSVNGFQNIFSLLNSVFTFN
jgi:hypothetical protein